MKPTSHKIKPTKQQLKIMKECWVKLKDAQDCFYDIVYRLEKKMSTETGIKDLEFFQCDNEWAGIGNGERTMRLLQRKDLE